MQYDLQKNLSVGRIRFIFFAIMGVVAILLGRLYFIQIVHGKQFSDLAGRQYVRPNYDAFDRGTIYFTEKDGSYRAAAGLASGFTLAVNPSGVKDPLSTYTALNAVVPLDKDTFLAKVQKLDDPYEEVADRLDAVQAAKVRELDLRGISIQTERWRHYPGGVFAAHTLGFVGFDGDTLRGRYGLERYYDDVLSRKSHSVYVNFFAELFANVEHGLRPAVSEGDLVVTIEPSVQAYLEQVLQQTAGRFSGQEIGGIVLDPKTGAVIALGAYPGFDPNTFGAETNVGVFSNPLVERVYEMGSIIKPLTMAIGIDTGAVTAGTTYHDTGSIVMNDYRISNFDGKARGTVPMQEVLSQSLNLGAVFVQRQAGNERFGDYMRSFGLGDMTGIDLPSETAGLIENLESTVDIDYATASFGQGIAFSPMATARALSVLANGGMLITPHLVTAVRSPLGNERPTPLPAARRVLKEGSTEEVTRMLVTVVDTALLEGVAKNPHYSIAAKTGTAQIAKPNGGYYEDRYLHSFFGYFPAFDARFLVFLYIREPVGARYASQTLTEPFMNLADFLLNYYDIPPDR